MSKVKKTSVSTLKKKTEKKPLKIVKASAKKIKPVKKNVSFKKKALPIIIDVIEDDENEISENNFPELPEIKDEMAAVSEISTKKNEPKDDIDQQKKFFSELITEIKEKNPKLNARRKQMASESEEDKAVTNKSVNLYRRLAWRFVALTAVLLLIVFYFSFSNLTIIISPKGEVINDNLLLKITSSDVKATNVTATSTETDFREQVAGTVKEVAVSGEKNFSASGEEFIGDEIAGQVNIINNSGKSQALVAKTRILSPDNKLFRIQNAVNVPAGGEVLVDIYADKPSEDLAIPATTFTIPGLWLGLQDKIYAKSTTDFVYRQKVKKYIKASDIEQATNEMNNILLDQAKQNEISPSQNEEVLYETLNPANFNISAQAGDAKDNFTIKASGSLVVINFSKTDVAKLATAKLNLLIPDDKQLVDYNSDNITYTFDNYDSKTGVATVKASFSGTMILKNDTEIIDKKQLVNLNQPQLENYLKTFPEIKSYEFKFFPAFITRAPRLPERISISIKGLEQ
jgi:hypothetical protein